MTKRLESLIPDSFEYMIYTLERQQMKPNVFRQSRPTKIIFKRIEKFQMHRYKKQKINFTIVQLL